MTTEQLIANMSNSRLEQDISNVYWKMNKWYPGREVKETGLLALMWEEFDRRAEAGTIDDE